MQYGVFGNFRLSYRSGFSFLPSLQSANDQDRSRAEERAENVQPRLRRAGEKPRQPPRDGQAQRRRLLPRLPGEKEDDAQPEDGGEKKVETLAHRHGDTNPHGFHLRAYLRRIMASILNAALKTPARAVHA